MNSYTLICRGIFAVILNQGTRCRWMVCFRLEKGILITTENKILLRFHSRTGPVGKESKFLPEPKKESRFLPKLPEIVC